MLEYLSIPSGALTVFLVVPILLIPIVILGPESNQFRRLQQLYSSEIVSLRVYPIKSCRGFTVNKSTLRSHGLHLDRQWMFVNAETLQFLTIRQIPEMTLINTGLSEDGNSLLLSITGVGGNVATMEKPISIPAVPNADWLEKHTTLSQVKVWDVVTDGYVYGNEVNEPFSRFLGRDVVLVYKGPTPRILQGNGDPQLLGRTQSVNFPDVHPILIASEASIAELNSRLRQKGGDPITIERFRPNIVVKGNAPWTEDSWKTVRFNSSSGSLTGNGDSFVPSSPALDLDIVARCARCQVPNVNPETAEKHPKQPWDTLVSYRRVDEGIKFKPCFGMLAAPRNEGAIEVGMRFDVLEETNQHRYIKGF
ncbi:MOSC domain-containing protein [Aspergillus ruber CBS 135680]|uniref:MOSC domain-containing protein n=1 Tax=Aspergillus ruber (strain CBS 135680) TaxID=1388766 RepID=A0A017SDN1_ASPRC|nr:uncharacterized protein EURHEDRAFT_515422 [Aspergillus ruber CBS 135680]EYE95098.1 hypothetical protein EURHEDRAFT_515422 [Aspergillus ruber CBS 135680]